MSNGPTERRSSTNPVRISLLDREDRNTVRPEARSSLRQPEARNSLRQPEARSSIRAESRSFTRSDPRKTNIRSRARSSSGDNTHIPRPRIRSSSNETSTRKSYLKQPGKPSLVQTGSTTPYTPTASTSRGATLGVPSGSSARDRSRSAERASRLTTPTGPKKDNRPILDKGYQSVMLGTIDNYLRKIKMSSMLNANGSLKPITLKMFVDVSNLLVNLMDMQKQNLTNANYLEELPKIAKKLNYPGVVNKSWLKTANAPHSWANVLGWLSWLVEIINLKDLAEEEFQLHSLPFLDTDGKGEVHPKTFDFLLEAYSAWNDEKLDEEKQLVDKYLEEVTTMAGVRKEDVAKARAELNAARANFEAEDEKDRAVAAQVKEVEEFLKNLRVDEAKQDGYIKAKREYIEGVKMQKNQIIAENSSLRDGIKRDKSRQIKLIERINSQPMSAVERDKIIAACCTKQEYLHSFDKHLNNFEKEVYTLDIKMASLRRNLDEAILSYNKEVFVHIDQTAEVDSLKIPERGILRDQFPEELEASMKALKNLKDDFENRNAEVESLITANEDKVEALQEKMTAMKEEKDAVAANVIDKKKCISSIKAAMKTEEARLKEIIRELNNDLKEMHKRVPDFEKDSSDLAETEDKLQAVQRKKEYLQERAKLFFGKFFKILADHRTELAAALENHKEKEN